MVQLVALDFDGTVALQRGGWLLLTELYGNRGEMEARSEAYRADDSSFAEWCRGNVADWRERGVTRTDVERAAAAVVPTPGAETVLTELGGRGIPFGFISSGLAALQARFDEFDPVFALANELVFDDGVPVDVRPRVGPDDKGRLLRDVAQRRGIDLADVLYVGDSHSDVEAFGVAGRAVLFDPDERFPEDAMADVDAVVDGPELTPVLDHLG
jgi:phosphoserine phosphatase